MPSNQKKIRDLERLAKKLSGDEQENIAKRISELRDNKATNILHEKERKNAKKYHMVRFFERRKVIRKIKLVETKLKDAGKKEKKVLESELADHMKNLTYIMYFPKSEKYIGIMMEDFLANEDESSRKNREQAMATAIAAREADQTNGKDLVVKALSGPQDEDVEGLEGEGAEEENDEEASTASSSIKSKRARESSTSPSDGKRKRSTSSDSSSRKKGSKSSNENKGVSRDLAASSSNSNDKYEPDAFFAEEESMAPNRNDVNKSFASHGKNNNYERSGAAGGSYIYRGGHAKAQHAGRGRGGRSLKNVNTDGMSKQELRLHMWQEGKANRSRGRGV